MVEKHVNPASAITDHKFFLSSDKSKSGTKLKQETGYILFKGSLKLFFLIVDRNSDKSKIIIIFCYFLRHTTLSFRKIFSKITDSPSVRHIQIRFERIIKSLPAPAP